ncbi:MAG: iron-containing alcohol dehydrogenase [Pseudomonadota bacterium]
MTSVNWSYPTAIRFGTGRIRELADTCRTAGIQRPLFVTDRGLADLQITKDALALLEDEKLPAASFSGVDSNPHDGNLDDGLRILREGDHDGVIGFGGGSALDLGKLLAFMVGQDRPVWDFEDIGDWWTRANADAILPNIAVPTTAGTGSEVGRASVLTNRETHLKKVIFHPGILPVTVICDPALTVGMPQAITAGTGMDAFAHCLEAYSSPMFHPMGDGIALEGMRLVLENLSAACKTPEDLEARGAMMSAALMGAVAFQKGLGAIHAISHPVGARFNTHHGMTNAVVMPAVLRFNRPAIEQKIARASAYLGISGGFDGFYGRVLELRAEIGVPDSLRSLGVNDGDPGGLAAAAVEDPTAAGNPVPLTVEAAHSLFAECMG